MNEGFRLNYPTRQPSRQRFSHSNVSSSGGDQDLDYLLGKFRRKSKTITADQFSEVHRGEEELAELFNPGLQFMTDVIDKNANFFRSIIFSYGGLGKQTNGVIMHSWLNEQSTDKNNPYRGIVLGRSSTDRENSRALPGLALATVYSASPLGLGIIEQEKPYTFRLIDVSNDWRFSGNIAVFGIGPYEVFDERGSLMGENLCVWKVGDLFLIKQLALFGMTQFTEEEAKQDFFNLQDN